jgi:nucleoside 2-deoxyribosyltransferase
MKIYLAGPLFTLAERRFNEELAGELEKRCPALQVVLPQRYDTEFSDAPDFSERVFACVMESIDCCDAVVAIVDGPDADSGTCIEIGYAKGRGKKVVGVRTDFRGSEDHGLNLMVANICTHLLTAPSTSTTLGQLAEKIVTVLMDGAAPQESQVAAAHRPEVTQVQ